MRCLFKQVTAKEEERKDLKKKEVYLCRNVRMLYVYLSVKERLSFFSFSFYRRDVVIKKKNGFLFRLLVWEKIGWERKIRSNV